MSTSSLHPDNAAQADYWNGVVGRRWSDHQERQDQVLKPISERLLAVADAKPGELVIDVGCGCGSLTIDVAARVAPHGEVLGLDISEPMLARARERAPEDCRPASFAPTPRSMNCRRARSISSCRGSASCSSPIPPEPSPICAGA